MKSILLLTIVIFAVTLTCNAQNSPPLTTSSNHLEELNQIFSLSDTINFTPFVSGTNITTQYLNKGVVFSGFNGSGAPLVYDYISNFGRILHSDNWFNPLRINFVDSLNANQYRLAKTIEFDNAMDSLISVGEIDYMSIDVYDSMDVLIYHYLSISPEHVVLNFSSPTVAYITIDDSANTAFIVDNILVDFSSTTSINEFSVSDYSIYPNPFSDELKIDCKQNEQIEVIIYDIASRKMLEQSITNSTNISTEQLQNGVYVYELKNKNGLIKKGKVIKN